MYRTTANMRKYDPLTS